MGVERKFDILTVIPSSLTKRLIISSLSKILFIVKCMAPEIIGVGSPMILLTCQSKGYPLVINGRITHVKADLYSAVGSALTSFWIKLNASARPLNMGNQLT